MVKKYHGVAKGRVPGIYINWSLANEQTDGYPSECHAGFDDLDSCVAFMLANHHSEESIKVFGQRGGQYSLRDWIRRRSQDDDEPSTHTTGIHESDVTHDGNVADGQSVSSRSSQDSHHAQSRTINNAVIGYAAGYIHQRPNAEIKSY